MKAEYGTDSSSVKVFGVVAVAVHDPDAPAATIVGGDAPARDQSGQSDTTVTPFAASRATLTQVTFVD